MCVEFLSGESDSYTVTESPGRQTESGQTAPWMRHDAHRWADDYAAYSTGDVIDLRDRRPGPIPGDQPMFDAERYALAAGW